MSVSAARLLDSIELLNSFRIDGFGGYQFWAAVCLEDAAWLIGRGCK